MHPSTFFSLLEHLFLFSTRPPNKCNVWVLEQILEALDTGMDDSSHFDPPSGPSTWDPVYQSAPDQVLDSEGYPSAGQWHSSSTPTAESQSGYFYSPTRSESGYTGSFPQAPAWQPTAPGTRNVHPDSHLGEQHMAHPDYPTNGARRTTIPSAPASVADTTSIHSMPRSAPSLAAVPHRSVSENNPVSEQFQKAQMEVNHAKVAMIRTGVEVHSEERRFKHRMEVYERLIQLEAELRHNQYMAARELLNDPAFKDAEFTQVRETAMETVIAYLNRDVPLVNWEALLDKAMSMNLN